jgi:predicted transcriptional regulator
MKLQVPPELEAKQTRLAAIDHDEWFRSEVEKGRASAREGRMLEHDDVAARMDRHYRV